MCQVGSSIGSLEFSSEGLAGDTNWGIISLDDTEGLASRCDHQNMSINGREKLCEIKL